MLKKHLLITLVLLLGLWVLGGCGGGASFMPIEESLAADAGQLDSVIEIRNPSNGDLPADEIVYMSDFKYGQVNHLYSIYLNEGTGHAELEDLGTFPDNSAELPSKYTAGYHTFNAQIGTTADGSRVYCFDYWSGMMVYYDVELETFVDTGFKIHTGSTVLNVGEVTFGAPYEGNDWGDLYVATTAQNNILKVDPYSGAAEDMGTIAYDGGGIISVSAGDLAFDDAGNFYLLTVGSPGKGIYLIDGWEGDGPWTLTGSQVRTIGGSAQYRGLAILDGGAGDWLGDNDTSGNGPPDYIVRFGASDAEDSDYPMYLGGGLFDHGAGGDMSVGRLGQEPCPPYETALIAGQNMTVGTVTVEPVDGKLVVTYTITDDDWCITETHLHVATSLAGIPQTKKGNPIPGQFDYQGEHNCVPEVVYELTPPDDGSWCDSEFLYIAAHAVVRSVYGDADPTMYLAEIYEPKAGRPPTGIFSVAWSVANSRYELTKIGELGVEYDYNYDPPKPTKAFYSAHIAVSSDGLYIYGIDNGNYPTSALRGHLAKYDIANDTTYDVGDTGLLDCTQLAFAPDGKLYAATTNSGINGADTNTLWEINTTTAAATKIGKLGSILVGGADMVFKADGYLYVMTNQGSEGLYKVDYTTSPPTVVSHIWTKSTPEFTGMADTFDGAGYLIASTAGYDNRFAVFQWLDGSAPGYFDMYYPSDAPNAPTYQHYWGDMTSLPAPDYVFETAWGDGEDFPGNNWATYILWEVCCED